MKHPPFSRDPCPKCGAPELYDSNAQVRSSLPDRKGGYYWTPLTAAVEMQNQALIALLVKYGADLNQTGGGRTPLSMAVWLVVEGGGEPDLVEFLLSLGADPNVQDGYATTPLGLARQYDHRKLCKVLYNAGGR